MRYKYIWLSFQVMWRYCRDSCPAASCIPVIVVSELRSYIESLQFFQRLWLCRSYPCPNISVLSWNTFFVFVFFSAVFFKVLELTEREAPKDFCYFDFCTFLGLCNHSHSSSRIQLCVRCAELLCPPAKPLQCPTATASVHQSAVTLCSLLERWPFLDCKSEVHVPPGDFFRLWSFHLLQIWKSVGMIEDLKGFPHWCFSTPKPLW